MQRLIFSPESVFWRVNRELLIGLAGSRSLLLEIAHPMVATGVADHSNFQREPFRRLYRTMRFMSDITFGTVAEARQAARHMHRCHWNVEGNLRETLGPYKAGDRYRAADPALKLWVFSTIIDTALRGYELFVERLSADEAEAYYRDSKELARWFGIPEGVLPATHRDFDAYMQDMFSGGELEVGAEARAIASALYKAGPSGKLIYLPSLIGIGLLPPGVRDGFGFYWDDRRERWLKRFASLCRKIRPNLPEALCISPAARAAELRLIRAEADPVSRV